MSAQSTQSAHSAQSSVDDFFTQFGLPRQYPLDRASLDSAYERLSLEHHPDFFATAPEAEKLQAERMAAGINEGYQVLSSDAARAKYLLGLLSAGRTLDSEALPPGFLMEMFELQEEVEELEGVDESQAAGTRKTALRKDAQAKLDDILAQRGRLFDSAGADGSPGTPKAGGNSSNRAHADPLQEIQTHLNCERYLMRLLDRLDGKSMEH